MHIFLFWFWNSGWVTQHMMCHIYKQTRNKCYWSFFSNINELNCFGGILRKMIRLRISRYFEQCHCWKSLALVDETMWRENIQPHFKRLGFPMKAAATYWSNGGIMSKVFVFGYARPFLCDLRPTATSHWILIYVCHTNAILSDWADEFS